MDSQKLKVLIIIALATLAALYLGMATATAQVEVIAWVGGVASVVMLLSLGRNVWALIPLALCLSGGLNFLPGAPAAWYIATPLAGLFLMLRFLARSPNFVWRWTRLDTLVLLNVVMLLQAYIRNPTGLSIFGGSSGNIGGKTYIDYCLVTGGFYLLGAVKTEWTVVRRVLYLMVGLQICDGLLGAATSFSGSLSAAVSHVYGNVDFDAASAGLEGGNTQVYGFDMNTRFANLVQIGLVSGLICCTFWRPISFLNVLRPHRLLLLMLSLGTLLMGGFRSQLIRLFLLFIAGTFVRRKPTDLILASALVVVLLCVIVAGSFARDLPFAAQRALSFLPIGVSEDVKAQADSSSEWRFEMWRLALTTDRYIQNKFWGDGFGFTAAELRISEDKAVNLTGLAQQEFFMSKGSYHGFHVECIRFVGAVGLLISTCILIACSVRAWQLIRYFEGRPGWVALLFLCVPYLIEPIQYWWLFGSYKGNFMPYLLGAGLLKMLDNIRVAELAETRATALVEQPAARPGGWVPMPRQPVRGG